ncbi:TP53-regulated inhibitor of apoptosis 1 [Halyomorpha halys]|uniref:TP53-regulated inhibitor of apoptosis 1 n=1 Tax=Halyomorpha halys TaxID=286706 RepID=UPI0006D52688|nr:TP53-regulated inhibitor of apoptosis 1-like [Halyomorpha halys]XP_014286649.1 TP53-regulated inhibitor of apoptosis 1-like [Halyomorpha halys]XP_024215568.1 TP53-regulated inhibitor of apoptosis 1-like [Halyomorpha halys]
MNSIGNTCNEIKHQYDECFQSWFTEKFLKGTINDDACDPLFKLYQQCIQKTMKENHIEVKDAEINYLGTDKECTPPLLKDKKSK